MPQEGDERPVGGVYEGYLDGRWIAFDAMTEDQIVRWLAASSALLGIGPGQGAGVGLDLPGLPGVEGSGQQEAMARAYWESVVQQQRPFQASALPEPPGWTEEADGSWPPRETIVTKNKFGDEVVTQGGIDYKRVKEAYALYGDPREKKVLTREESDAEIKRQGLTGQYSSVYKGPGKGWTPEPISEGQFRGFATEAEAAQNAPPGHAPQYNPQTNAWLNEPVEVEEQPRPVFVETGGGEQRNSIEQLIVDALVEGDFAKATRYDDFRRRPSIADAIQIASQYAKNAGEFQELLGLMQAFGGFGPETPFEPSFAKAPGVTPGQAAEAVGRFAAGEVGAKPPTPWTPPGFKQPPQVSDIALLPELTVEQIQGMGEDPANYFGENARRLKERYYALNPPQPPPGRLQPLPPEWEEALRHTKETLPENYPAALKWAQQYQEAQAQAKALGGKGAVGVGPVGGGQLGTGFVLDLSNLTPQQLQSQFGPLAQPRMEALEGLSWEEQKQLTGLGDEALSAEWQTFGEWRKRQPKKPTAQQFERFLSLTKPQKPPAVPVTRRF